MAITLIINYSNNNYNHNNNNDGNATNDGRVVLNDNDTVDNNINVVYGNDGSRMVRVWNAQLNQFKIIDLDAEMSHHKMIDIVKDHKLNYFNNRFKGGKSNPLEFFTKHNSGNHQGMVNRNNTPPPNYVRKKKDKIAPSVW